MRYRIDFENGEPVYYKTGKEKIAAVITAVKENPQSHADFQELYTIRVTTNRCFMYQKGQVFTTSGEWLRKRGKVKADNNSEPRPKRNTD